MTMKQPHTDSSDSPRNVIAVDLFCGAGGFSEGIKRACNDLGYDLQHAAINHWDVAIQSHKANHKHAVQFHSRIEQLHPPDVVDAVVDDDVRDVHVDGIDVDLLTAGPECERTPGSSPGASCFNDALCIHRLSLRGERRERSLHRR